MRLNRCFRLQHSGGEQKSFAMQMIEMNASSDVILASVCLPVSVKERCLAEQKKRRQRATKKICIFIGSFILCFSPYVITR